MSADFRSGYVAITGRPNVGKSTLMNRILGQKISIVSSRPQTTRNRILGIKNIPGAQVVFIDTPGIHTPKHGLGAYMVREAKSALQDVEVVLLIVEPEMPGKAEEALLRTVKGLGVPVFLVINKIDKIKKNRTLPLIERYSAMFAFEAIMPISAKTGDGVDGLLQRVVEKLPPGPMYYPEDLITDAAERFLVAEIVREKVMVSTREEVPHACAVEVVTWSEDKGKIHIRADILVEKPGQKGIIIGKQGAMLKSIGAGARADIEALLGTGVFLELFVKVKADWRMKKSILADLGFK